MLIAKRFPVQNGSFCIFKTRLRELMTQKLCYGAENTGIVCTTHKNTTQSEFLVQ
jgi:hypothetical protein